MSKSVVILQSSYIPWKGYFDLVHDASLFVFYDDVQFTKSDWRNRNKIKANNGAEWITIPVGGETDRLINEVQIENNLWQAKHWKTIQQNYTKCPFFSRYRGFFEDIYLGRRWGSLSELNQYLIRAISEELLGINMEFRDSSEFEAVGKKLDRLFDLVIKTHADRYISGPAAKGYIDPDQFSKAGIELAWKDYSGYPVYPQRHPPFEHGVSIIDLLFNVGPDAPWYIWGWREGGGNPV